MSAFGSGQLDFVLSELEEIEVRLAELESANGDVPAVRELHGRLRASLAALENVVGDERGRRDEFVHALEAERRRYRELFEFAPGAYLTTDVRGMIEESNTAACVLFGIPAQHLVGKPLAVFVELPARRAFRALLRRLAHAEEVGDQELPLRGRHGMFEAVVTVAPIFGEGSPVGFRWLVRDVTERRRAEREVRTLAADLETRVADRTRELDRERALLAAVIEQMPAGVVITEAATRRLLVANAQAWAIARERFAEAEGLEPLVGMLHDAELSGELVEVVRGDGTRGVLEVNAAPIRDPDGSVSAAVAIFQDVTARERREQAEREFVTNAAHELQTPLTAITSAAEVLQAGAKEVPEDRDRFLAHIQNECDRLARLVHALLELARAQTGGQGPTAERVPIKPLLEDVARGLRPASAVRVEVRCPGRLAALVNRDLAEQAVLSIAGNAAKYTLEGSISLVGRRLDSEYIAIEVTDTGPGVADDERPLVFERFYRGVTRDRTGFGLGLAIAEQAARVLGGQIALEAGPEGGTTVRLTLPAAARS